MIEYCIDPEPCSTCPYRIDTPPGVWAATEYRKLPLFDGETFEQDPSVFLCHHSDHPDGTGRDKICRGWAAVHDHTQLLGLRLAHTMGSRIPWDELERPVKAELYASGAEACAAGLAGVEEPSEAAIARIEMLKRRNPRRSSAG